MLNTITHINAAKTKVIIAFVLLFINFCAIAQSIPRDTNAVDFIGALDACNAYTTEFTGYLRYRQNQCGNDFKKISLGSIGFFKITKNGHWFSQLDLEGRIHEDFKNEFKNGQTYSIVRFDNGKQILNYFFYANGNIRSIRIPEGNINSPILGNKLRGPLKKNYASCFLLKPAVGFFTNGKISDISYYEANKILKQNISYFPSGNIRVKTNYIKDNSLGAKLGLSFTTSKAATKIDGLINSYYENGKIKNIAVIKNDYLHGLCLYYSEMGNLDSTLLFIDNLKQLNFDTTLYKSQFLILKTIAEEENKNIDRKDDLIKNIENLKKTEEEKRKKEEELRHQQEEIKRNQLELELLAKDKAVSALTIKAKEAELLKNTLLANEKKKEIEQLNQQKLIDELSIKNKESEIAKKNIEAENKQKQIHGLEKEKELSNENLKQQKFIQKLMIAGSGLLGVFLLFVFFSLAKSRKANKLIAAQKTEVEKQKEISDSQKHLIEEKQTEIIESITYAKRLQEAILPPQAFINSFIPSNFILYKPKDIVAGDFYWAENIGDLFFIAAADSTGHGVPGAMVSVVCSNALNRSVKEFHLTETGKILDKTKELVVETFEKSTSEVKDGMDISLLCIDTKNKKVFWSGANNPLWYVCSSKENESHTELVEVKADKQPIGKTDKVNPFTTHEIEFKENTTFYLFTDGFADQFGGPNGKKFKYKPFAEILVKNVTKTPSDQSAILAEKFEAWKGELEQVDDVCIIGVKI